MIDPNLNEFFSRSFISSNQITIWKKKEKEKEKKDDGKKKNCRKANLKYLKNGYLYGLFHFITRAVNILLVCYIYENFPILKLII